MSKEEIGPLISDLHKAYYVDDFTPSNYLAFHRAIEALFNYAEIEDTLVVNNPNEVSPNLFKVMLGIDETKEKQ